MGGVSGWRARAGSWRLAAGRLDAFAAEEISRLIDWGLHWSELTRTRQSNGGRIRGEPGRGRCRQGDQGEQDPARPTIRDAELPRLEPLRLPAPAYHRLGEAYHA